MATASNVTRLKGSSSIQSGVSAAEWETRVDLAAAHRFAELSQWTDLIFNHFTARVPGEPRHFLVKQHELMFEEVTASNLVKLDLDGNPVGESQHVNAAGYTIHTAVLEARPDVNSVMHVHSPAGTVLSAHKHGIRYLCQEAMMFYNRVGYHDFEGVAVDLEERERLAKNLGNYNTLILRNHGLLTCGRTIAEALILMHNLVAVAEVQARMEATGQEMSVPPDDVCERTAQQFEKFRERDSGRVQWQAILRYLDRRDGSFRD
ncbi:MAG TPA: class II aldolase/adducin family protein [Xanthobacteraceae bacterium]|nr:class II aldolase/adducin family protein [Xanthobacteraceae bacterium]